MKLLLIDDHHIVRQGLAALIRLSVEGAEVIETGEARTGFSLAEAHPDLDVIILDLALPGIDGFSALREFGHRRPDVPVIVLSSSEDAADARRALEDGALGYVPKSASHNSLLGAIRLVMDGEIYVPPFLLGGGLVRPASAPAQSSLNLTNRQIDVLRLLVEGRSNKEIARDLELAEKTVKVHTKQFISIFMFQAA
jgi:DNA-binding NarL/FixJ family response regulator